MGFLEIAGADLGRGNVGCDRDHRHARAMAIEEAVDEVQASPARSCPAQTASLPVRCASGACGEGRHLLMPHMQPLDAAVAAERVRKSVQTVANDAVDALDAGGRESLDHLIGDSSRHLLLVRLGRSAWQSSLRPDGLRVPSCSPVDQSQGRVTKPIQFRDRQHAGAIQGRHTLEEHYALTLMTLCMVAYSRAGTAW